MRVFLHHAGEIINDAHNWVLLRPDARNKFVEDADREPDETVIVPPGDEYLVLAGTPLCGRGQTVMAEFTAPTAARAAGTSLNPKQIKPGAQDAVGCLHCPVKCPAS